VGKTQDNHRIVLHILDKLIQFEKRQQEGAGWKIASKSWTFWPSDKSRRWIGQTSEWIYQAQPMYVPTFDNTLAKVDQRSDIW